MAEQQRNCKRRLGRAEHLKKTISHLQKTEQLCGANKGLNIKKLMKQLAVENKCHYLIYNLDLKDQ